MITNHSIKPHVRNNRANGGSIGQSPYPQL